VVEAVAVVMVAASAALVRQVEARLVVVSMADVAATVGNKAACVDQLVAVAEGQMAVA
jgi:hypothetical protein